jgi:hypothetical protein
MDWNDLLENYRNFEIIRGGIILCKCCDSHMTNIPVSNVAQLLVDLRKHICQ